MSRFTRAIYRAALLAYPPSFRERFGASMLATYEDARRTGGAAHSLPREVIDLVATGIRERFSESQREKMPERSAASSIELLGKDVRYAARGLVRNPGFTLVAAISLALGIGANAAIFSLVNGTLIKPMPVERPSEIVALYATRANSRFPYDFSYPNYLDLTSESRVFSEVVGSFGSPVSSTTRGAPELVWSELVTANYFEGLGVDAAAGRLFTRDDVDAPVAVLSHEFWERSFGADPNVAGRELRLNGHRFTVTGVARRGFTGVKLFGFNPDIWVPIEWHRQILPGDAELLERRHGGWLDVRARLAEGVSLEEAEAALAVVARRLEDAHPDVNRDWGLHAIAAPRKVEPFFDVMAGGAIPVAAGALLGIVAIVLLIACGNVASLSLARALGREKEMALRMSLGASRSSVLRQLFVESVLLCVLAGSLGLWLSGRILEGALRLNPVLDFGIDYGVALDGRVLAFTAAVSFVAAMLSGFYPAIRALRRDIASSVLQRSESRGLAGRRWLVIPQLALSLVALVASALLLSSFQQAKAAKVGFDREGLHLASFNLDLQGYDQPAAREWHARLLDRARALPEISSASLAFPLPLDAYQEGTTVFLPEADSERPDEGRSVFVSVVHDDYFETLGTSLLYGRGFDARDDESAAQVAVVNETLALALFDESDAVGRRIRLGRDDELTEIVGVAENGKYITLGEEPSPYLFLPMRQNYGSPVTLVVRSDAPAAAVASSLREVVSSLDDTLPLFGVRTMDQFLERSLAAPRALAASVSGFALLALTLATLGIYGLMSFTVSQRRHEIGVRMALGAGRKEVVSLFVRKTAFVVAVGVGAGLVLAWLAARLLASLLYGVGASEPLLYLGVALALAFVALLGGYIPSRRAARLDPLVTLRYD